MPKTLYLVRHAKSSWKNEGLTDEERPLNKRGKHDAPLMGKHLKQRGETPDLLISSTAKRALSTAKLIAGEMDYAKDGIVIIEELYMADINDFIGVIEKINNSVNSIMLFGHNPGITYFANFISGSDIENIPTSGTAKISFDFNSWGEIKSKQGKLEFFLFPKMFSKD